MNRKLVIKRAVIWMLSMMITLCSASPVWATEAAPAAAAAENLSETGNGKTEEIKPAETNLSEAKREKNLVRQRRRRKNRLRRKKKRKALPAAERAKGAES